MARRNRDAIDISYIFEKCKSYSIESLNLSLAENPDFNKEAELNNIMSSFFLNVDGNHTNFNHLLAILKSINHNFKAIGLAEPNTGPNTCQPYIIPNYKSFYQNTREGKKSGSGVSIYIHNSLTATVINELSVCTVDIESIVVKITNTETSIYIGAIYRPNDGNKTAFYEHLQNMYDFLFCFTCFPGFLLAMTKVETHPNPNL